MYDRFVQLLQEKEITAYRVSKDTGVTQTTLSDWKTGRATPRTATLQKIADYFDVTLDWLVGKSDYRNGEQYSTDKDIILVARHLEDIPIEDRKVVITAVENTINAYLRGKRGNKED